MDHCFKWIERSWCHFYMWMGWDWMVIIGPRPSKSTFGANKCQHQHQCQYELIINWMARLWLELYLFYLSLSKTYQTVGVIVSNCAWCGVTYFDSVSNWAYGWLTLLVQYGRSRPAKSNFSLFSATHGTCTVGHTLERSEPLERLFFHIYFLYH